MTNANRLPLDALQSWLVANDEPINADERHTLNQWIVGSPQVRERLILLAQQQAWLMWHGSTDRTTGLVAEPAHTNQEDQHNDADRDDAQASVLGSTTSLLPELPASRYQFRPFSSRSILLGTAVLLTTTFFWAVLAFLVVPKWREASHELELMARTRAGHTPIGQLIRNDGCRWKGSGMSTLAGAKLLPGPLHLLQGTAEISLDGGVRAVLKGPTVFELSSAKEIYLRHGRLTAKVPQSAVGFTVSTPNATIVDLGTEFEVEVSEAGVTDVQVRRGLVEVAQPRNASAVRTTGKVRVSAGELVRVDELGMTPVVTATGNKKADLAAMRRTGPFIDLADIVAGGMGDSHRQGAGIHPVTGRIVRLPEPNENYRWFAHRLGTGKYMPAKDRPLIDGVSVPDSSKGPVQLDSAGHTFAGFPLADGRTFGPVWAGGRVPMPPDTIAAVGEFCSTFDGRLDYSVAPHNMLAFIPNKLITFDLAAIRRVYPKRSLAAFAAVVGSTKPARMKDEPPDVWVFVDGELRFSRREINARHPELVKVPLTDTNRFLSLVSTDTGRKHAYDWVFFGDPRIEFEAADEKEERKGIKQDNTISTSK